MIDFGSGPGVRWGTAPPPFYPQLNPLKKHPFSCTFPKYGLSSLSSLTEGEVRICTAVVFFFVNHDSCKIFYVPSLIMNSFFSLGIKRLLVSGDPELAGALGLVSGDPELCGSCSV